VQVASEYVGVEFESVGSEPDGEFEGVEVSPETG
jgi:hypothetical protein